MRLYELKIGYRYTRGARNNKNRFVSFSSLMSMLGVIIGVASLIITLSVMNGFKENTINKMLSSMSHVIISSHSENEIMQTTDVENLMNSRKDVLEFKKEYHLSAGITANHETWGVFLSGVSNLEQSSLEPGKFEMLISRDMAAKRNLKVGDNVLVTLLKHKQVTPMGTVPRQKKFKVIGLYHDDDKRVSNSFVLINNKDAQSLSQLEHPNTLKINIKNFWDAPDLKDFILKNVPSLSKNINDDIFVEDWTTVNKRILTLLKIEKVVAMIILMLVIVVAAFNMISTMVMSVAEKKGEIAILRTMGCRPSSIMTIFMFQGCFVGFIGTVIGLALGLSIAFNVNEIVMFIDQVFKFNFLTDVLNEMKVSSVVVLEEVLYIVMASLVITLLSAIYPSWIASKVNPAEALKHE